MTISFAQAASAYQSAAKGGPKAISDDQIAAPGDATSASTGFADMLRNSIQASIDTSKSAEQLSMAAVAGKADLNEVVTAVAEAELTVKTVVAIRDKALEAYREIMRMPV